MSLERIARTVLTAAALIGVTTACAAEGQDAGPGRVPTLAVSTSEAPVPVSPPSSTWTPSPSQPSTPPPPPPPARRHVSAEDPVGDPDTRRPSDWFVPSTDITSVDITYDAASRSLEFRIGFADLRELEHDGKSFSQSIMLAGAGQTQNLYLERHPSRGVSLVQRSVPSLMHYGGLVEPCAGADTSIDLDADVVLIRAPARCVARGRTELVFSVWSGSERIGPSGRGRALANDHLEVQRAVRTR